MSFLKNLIRNAVQSGISRGIRDAVSNAAEKAIAPKAEAAANSVAAAVADEAAQNTAVAVNATVTASAMPVAMIREWGEKLPGFPVWCFGGKDFAIEINSTSDEGVIYYRFCAVGATYEAMCAYISVLKADGFVQKYKDSDQVLYKDLGSEYLVFSSVEAFNDLDVMDIGLHRTKNPNDM